MYIMKVSSPLLTALPVSGRRQQAEGAGELVPWPPGDGCPRRLSPSPALTVLCEPPPRGTEEVLRGRWTNDPSWQTGTPAGLGIPASWASKTSQLSAAHLQAPTLESRGTAQLPLRMAVSEPEDRESQASLGLARFPCRAKWTLRAFLKSLPGRFLPQSWVTCDLHLATLVLPRCHGPICVPRQSSCPCVPVV